MKNSLTQAQRSYENAVKAKYPTADMGGVASEVYVANGDTVSNGTKLMKIVGDNNIYIDFLFAYTAASEFYAGQKADVFITGYDGGITGVVTGVSDGTTASSTGALDSHTGREVIRMLQKLHEAGNTVVLITHDNSIAVQAERIIRLEDGRVVYDGDAHAPEAVVSVGLFGKEEQS